LASSPLAASRIEPPRSTSAVRQATSTDLRRRRRRLLVRAASRAEPTRSRGSFKHSSTHPNVSTRREFFKFLTRATLRENMVAMPHKKFRLAIACSIALAALASNPTLADVVVLKNGDKINGTIGQIADGKMEFKSPVLGDIKIDLDKIESYTTDSPATIRMKAKAAATQPIITDKIASGDATTVTTAGGQTINTGDVKVINRPKEEWTGAILALGTLQRGNTEKLDIGFRADATLRRASEYKDDRFTLGAAYNFGTTGTGDDSDTTTDNWMAFGKYDKFWTEKLYGYATVKVDHDRIADLRYRLSPGVGVGYQWIESPKTNFNTEAGISYVYEEYDPGDNNDFIALRLAYHFDHKLRDTVKIFHNFEWLPSFEDPGDYILTTDVGIRFDITENFFTEGRIEWKQDSEPAPNTHENDLRYIIGVGWRF
jgi:putative salt-induced outer membrane protein YdiY